MSVDAEMHDRTFRYDVAISFLAQDEALAIGLADRLRERMSVFVYSERQKELAGKDGLEAFTRVFRSDSRVCVILYREGWGKTKWTRVEETAIKDRAFDEGWDFLLVVALSRDGAPKWLPATKIWLGFERFGSDGLAAVVDARVHECGGEPREESARARMERLARLDEAEADRELFLKSQRGVKAARSEAEALIRYVEEEVRALRSSERSTDLRFERPSQDLFCAVSAARASFSVVWQNPISNSLRDSYLLVREYAGRYSPTGWAGGPRMIEEAVFLFTRTLEGTFAWVPEDESSRFYSTAELGEFCLKRMIDRAFGREDVEVDET